MNLHSLYLNSFMGFWLPIYEKQIKKYKKVDSLDAIIDVKDNIWKNNELTVSEKKTIFKMLKI